MFLQSAVTWQCRIPLNHALQIHTMNSLSIARGMGSKSPAQRTRRHTQHFRSVSGAGTLPLTLLRTGAHSGSTDGSSVHSRKKSQDDSALNLLDGNTAAAAAASAAHLRVHDGAGEVTLQMYTAFVVFITIMACARIRRLHTQQSQDRTGLCRYTTAARRTAATGGT